MKRLLHPLFAVLAAALLLGGCATSRMIDSDVQSFVGGAVPARPARYRFERLPSQRDAVAQEQLEAMAAAALAKVELTPAPLVSGAIAGTAAAAPTARYAVQVTAQIDTVLSPYGSPYVGGFWGHGHGRGFGGLGMSLEPTWYRHMVHILLRDSASGVPAYESSAIFDGPWSDSGRLLPVLLDAALQGYPNPPAGPRKVVIELPGDTPEKP
jgi:predicted small secreted protein